MKSISKIKPKVCPSCGSVKVASILYGLQAHSPELERSLAEGRVVLGGCVIADCDPAWQCIECEAKIYKEDDIQAMDYLTIDKGYDIPNYSEICGNCRHLFNSGVDRECLAFPDGIPMDIWMGYDPHTEPHPDQENDIVFEEKDSR